jgi:hypothetical protein
VSKSQRLYRITGGDINGRTHVTCNELAKYSGLPHSTIYSRLSRNIVNLKQLSKPVVKRLKTNKPKPKPLLDSTTKILMNKPFYDQSEAGVMWRLAMRSI